MKTVVQRVTRARVTVDGETVGSIDHNTQFAVSGWTVATTGADQPSTTPYFLPGASSLGVSSQSVLLITPRRREAPEPDVGRVH